MKLRLINIRSYVLLISDEAPNNVQFPETVAEKLNSGRWVFVQLDNENDIDVNRQKRIVAGIPGLPEIGIDAEVEAELLNNTYKITKIL